jgi:hypothetical protein
MGLRKFLCILSGEDWWILKRCIDLKKGSRAQNRFSSVGLFVLIIFVLCFVSAFYTFVQLFQSFWVGVPAGLFFSFMVTNIYLLLLYTLSPSQLPTFEDKTSRNASVIIRFAFIGLIAIFVAKPLEAMFFAAPLDIEIEAFKKEKLQKYTSITNNFFDSEISALKLAIAQEERLHGGVETVLSANAKEMIQSREAEREALKSRMEYVVTSSNYFMRRIVLLNSNYWYCWTITIFVIGVFFVPGIIKDRIPATGIFYGEKKDVERSLVKDEYQCFKETYSRIFQEAHTVDLELTEPYENPPFNTVRKTDKRKIHPQESLLRKLYNA